MNSINFTYYFKNLVIVAIANAISINVVMANIGLQTCGVYQFKGLVIAKKGKLEVVIHPKAKSEYKLNVSLDDFPKLAPYINKIITGELTVKKINHIWSADIIDLHNIEISFSDPLNQKRNSFLKLIKEKRCQ